MNKFILDEFEKSLGTGFIDKSSVSDIHYQPELLVNRKTPPIKVLSTILEELSTCEAFYISVAFVTTGGVATIINSLKSLESKGIKGKLLVSQYLNFTEPEALKKLLKFTNIDLRIATTSNSHSKGYLFKKSEYLNIIVGSSNLTATALCTNKEWNIKVSALSNSGIADKVITEFNQDFEQGTPVTPKYISEYEAIYRKQKLIVDKRDLELNEGRIVDIKPNSMQVEALRNLEQLRSEQKTKALLISATGTGKTFLSAFDAKAFEAKKLLFVVHRLTIAKKSMETFQRIFGTDKSMGLYSGEAREIDKDFLFCTVQTLSRPAHLSQFKPDAFDYIIIDESHRSGAESYQRVLDHFKPKFLLGMTATPERTDGNDIFKLFDHNIAYEIRLNRAMEEDMLSQFHYFGVSEISIDGKSLDDTKEFNYLTADERVERIIQSAEFYGSDNGITRGLVFCSRNAIAKELSKKFNLRNYNTIALTGENSEDDRGKAIDRLETDDLQLKLDYIFTVDIFNEGIDIPKVNQIIMIRPTDSAIIFIQQLGRGLRKVEGKGYLTVIDFIGNYTNNYLIPIALFGDTSYNKDKLRKLLSEGSRMIPGASTINFDEISKEHIFKSIDSANMQQFADLKKDYFLLKYKLGRIPMMVDFVEFGSRDPYSFVNYSRSYFNFVKRADKDFKLELPQKESKLLELFSNEINNGKRIEETIILNALIKHGEFSVSKLKYHLQEEFRLKTSKETIESSVHNLNFRFTRENKGGSLLPTAEVNDLSILTNKAGEFALTSQFQAHLKNPVFKSYLIDSNKYALELFKKEYNSELWNDGFQLYAKYSRKDVFRILNFNENPVAQNVGGYMVSQDGRHCPVFVNYHKDDDISESTKYEDHFINQKEFEWMSKSNRRISSKDVQSILGSSGKIRLPLFIKKNNDEGIDFYYMGDLTPNQEQVEQVTIKNDNGKELPVVKILFQLSAPVSTPMYQYLTENQSSKTATNLPIHKSESQSAATTKKPKPQTVQIPHYNFYAAAGSFSEMQLEKDYEQIDVLENTIKGKGYFACKVFGESMNRVIPNGAICLFKTESEGSRNGKIVLVENREYQDLDFNSGFTIKTYSSQKEVTEEGWNHTSILLRPNSTDSKYKDLVITEDEALSMRIVGEFVMVLDK